MLNYASHSVTTQESILLSALLLSAFYLLMEKNNKYTRPFHTFTLNPLSMKNTCFAPYRTLPYTILVILLFTLLITGCAKKESPILPALIPDSVLTFIWIPDNSATKERLSTTSYHSLYTHPDSIRLFQLAHEQLQKALQPTFTKYPATKELHTLLTETIPALYNADNGERFLAVTAIQPATQDGIHLIGGFRPKANDTPALKEIFARLQEYYQKHIAPLPILQKTDNHLTHGVATHDGTPYQWTEIKIDTFSLRICLAKHKNWYLYSISEAPLKQLIDALNGKNIPTASIASHPIIKQKLNTKPLPESIAYYDNSKIMPLFVDYCLNLLPTSPSSIEENKEAFQSFLTKSLKEQKHYAQFMATDITTSRIENKLIHDHNITTTAHNQNATEIYRQLTAYPLKLDTLTLTHPDTLIYAAFTADFVFLYNFIKQIYSIDPTLADAFEQIDQLPQKINLDLEKNILAPLGPECALTLDWPESSIYPHLSFWIQTKDPTAFKPTADLLINALREFSTGMYANKKETQHKDHTLIAYEIPMIIGYTPTLVLGPKGIGIFPHPESAHRFLDGSAKENETLSASATFNAQVLVPLQSLKKVNTAAYAHTARITQRAYTALAPSIMMAGGALFPEKTKDFFRSHPLPKDIQFTEALGEWTMLYYADDKNEDTYHFTSQSPVGMPIIPLYAGLLCGIVIHASPYIEEPMLHFADYLHAILHASESPSQPLEQEQQAQETQKTEQAQEAQEIQEAQEAQEAQENNSQETEDTETNQEGSQESESPPPSEDDTEPSWQETTEV